MLTDILWEVIAAAIYNRIATLITIIFQVLYSRIAQKKTPNKINYQGFNLFIIIYLQFLTIPALNKFVKLSIVIGLSLNLISSLIIFW